MLGHVKMKNFHKNFNDRTLKVLKRRLTTGINYKKKIQQFGKL